MRHVIQITAGVISCTIVLMIGTALGGHPTNVGFNDMVTILFAGLTMSRVMQAVGDRFDKK